MNSLRAILSTWFFIQTKSNSLERPTIIVRPEKMKKEDFRLTLRDISK